MALDDAGVQLIAQGVAAYLSDMGKADSATSGFFGTLGKAESAANGFEQVITGALRHVGAVLVDFAADGVKAIGGFVRESIGLAGDFESGMLEFQSAAGKDVDTQGLEEFRDLFLQIGKELPVSTAEVQQAAIELVKGGIDPATIAAGGLKQNIQFASAAMEGDLVKAAEISSKVMGGWTSQTDSASDKAAFLTHATDLLTKAANASSTDVEGLSLGLFNAQGIAKTAGVSFDDLTTTLAELAPRFASSSEAGNSLKNVIARLQPTTDPAYQAMQALGLITEDGKNKFYDASGAFVGFETASELLQNSLHGLTKQQQQSILQTIFGNDAMNAAAALAELGAEGYQAMADSLANANGVQEAAALKQQGFNTALDNAKGSAEALQITIGSALLPVLTELLNNVVAPAVNTLTDMADAIFGNDEAFNRLSPTAQAIVSVLDVLIADVQEIIGAFQDAGAGSSEFGEAIGLLASDLGLPGDLIEDIIFGVQDLVSWFNEAGDAGDSLGAVIDDLSSIWTKALGIVQDVMGGYQDIAQSVLPIVTTFWEDHGAQISAFFEEAYRHIMQIVNTALDLYDAIVPKALHSVANWIEEHATGIQAVLSGAWGAISGIIDGALTLIEGILKIALDVIHGDWSKAWTDLQDMSVRFVQDLEQVIEGFLTIIAGFFNTNLQEIADLWQHNWDALYEIATETDWAQVGADVVSGILQGLRDNWDSLMGWLSDKAHDLVDAALDAIGAGSPAVEFMPVGQFAVQGIMQGLSDTWPQLTQQIGSLSSDLIDDMQDIGAQIQDAIASGFGATASIDRQMAKNLDRIGEIGDDFTRQVVAQDLDTLQKKATELFSDPQTAAKYFKMVSDQEFETLDLRKQIAAASTQAEKDRLTEQLNLISRAQEAELEQFYHSNQAGGQSPLLGLADQINEVMKTIAGIHLTDDQIHIVDQLSSMWYALQTSQANLSSALMHPASSSYNRTTTLNMPIYTNNSPAAMQDSMAIAMAGLL